jgi:cytochrome P450/nitrite reductase/ring-hydroxylating ferredoxin subunit
VKESQNPDTNSDTSRGSWTVVGRLSDLQGEGPFARSAEGVDLVLVATASGVKAYQGRCPHQGALLGEGEMDGDTLVCRNHRWRFDVNTGSRHGGPECLLRCPIETRGDEIWADVGELRGAVAPRRSTGFRRLESLPGPKGIPLLGNMHQLDLPHLHQVLERWAAEYGTLFTYRMGKRRILVVSDHQLNEQILRARPEAYRRMSTIEPVFEEMGVAGVFSAEGAAWRPQRRLAMDALSHRHLRGFYPTLATIAGRLRTRWDEKARGGAVLDLSEELKRFTVDVTTLLTLGHDVDTIGHDADVIQRKLELIFPAFTRRLFALLPTWRWVRLPVDRRLDRALLELREWLGELIADARARLAADPERTTRPANFLESMLAARDAEGQPFSDDMVIANAMTMLVAGEDTTANTLAWAVHHLCDAPDAVERLRGEADAALGSEFVPPDIQTANRLSYAGAVANEAMRLRPVAPLLYLEANDDVDVGTVAVPRGTRLALLTRPAAIDARNFGDPALFRPERWLNGASEGKAHEISAHIPFGTGPRICPGRTLALVEMKTLLAMLYRTFDVERVGHGADVSEEFSFTMAPVGLKVRIRPRPDGSRTQGMARLS